MHNLCANWSLLHDHHCLDWRCVVFLPECGIACFTSAGRNGRGIRPASPVILMQDPIPNRPFKRRRLFPRRPHPDVESLLRRGLDLSGLWTESFDDSAVLDRQDWTNLRAVPGR